MPHWPDAFATLARKLSLASLPAQARGALRAQLELSAGADQPVEDTAPRGRIVVLAPHMDDETFGCGGTLAAAVANGATITVVFLTDSSKGYDPSQVATFSQTEVAQFERELATQRKEEARLACSALGIRDLRFLDFPDSALAANPDSIAALTAILVDAKAEEIFLPFFCDPHPDHWNANRLLVAAAREKRFEPVRCWGYEVWNPLCANVIVEISSTIEAKTAAIAAYPSQNRDRDYARAIVGLNVYRALQIERHGGYGEAFYRAPLHLYLSLFEHFSSAHVDSAKLPLESAGAAFK